GDEPDLMRKMAIGQIDGAMITTAGLTLAVPDFWIFQMPMLFQSYAELDYVRDRLAPDFAAKLRKKGFVMLNWGEAGWVRFFSNQPVVTTDDLRRIKLFVWAGDPGPLAHWKKEGFRPVPLPVPELFSALQSGMVDAYATTSVASLSFQWFGLAPHMTDLKWGVLVGGTVMRVKVWDRLPKAVWDKMMVAAKKAGVRFRERTRSLEAEAVRVMQRNGLTVHKVPPADQAVWEAAARRSDRVVVGPFVSPQFAERAMRLRDEFRGALAEVPAVN
ncbi:MAG: TRAP transporter substrate-binding protein DctP, partial [Alphaproteobacteria bacterium]